MLRRILRKTHEICITTLTNMIDDGEKIINTTEIFIFWGQLVSYERTKSSCGVDQTKSIENFNSQKE